MPVSTLYFKREPSSSSSAAGLPAEVVATGLRQKIINQEVDGCDKMPSDCFLENIYNEIRKNLTHHPIFLLDLK
jgi:hypothetical protein